MSSKILDINDNSFDKEVIFYNKYVLVVFFSNSCGPCKSFMNILNDIYIYFINKLKFVKLNVEKSNIIIKKYNILNIPTSILFKNKKILFCKVGILNKYELMNILNLYCSK